jgi:hypothetical protein
MTEVRSPEWVQDKKKRPNAGRPEKYPWSSVEIGGTFLVPVDRQTCSFKSFQVMCGERGRKLNKKFHCRVRPDDQAFEVWREW